MSACAYCAMARLVILEQPQHLLHARNVQRVAAL